MVDREAHFRREINIHVRAIETLERALAKARIPRTTTDTGTDWELRPNVGAAGVGLPAAPARSSAQSAPPPSAGTVGNRIPRWMADSVFADVPGHPFAAICVPVPTYETRKELVTWANVYTLLQQAAGECDYDAVALAEPPKQGAKHATRPSRNAVLPVPTDMFTGIVKMPTESWEEISDDHIQAGPNTLTLGELVSARRDADMYRRDQTNIAALGRLESLAGRFALDDHANRFLVAWGATGAVPARQLVVAMELRRAWRELIITCQKTCVCTSNVALACAIGRNSMGTCALKVGMPPAMMNVARLGAWTPAIDTSINNGEYIVQRKHNGQRATCHVYGSARAPQVMFYSKKGHLGMEVASLRAVIPHLARDVIASLTSIHTEPGAVYDGEIVQIDATGAERGYAGGANAGMRGSTRAVFYAFDILVHGSIDVRHHPADRRYQMLLDDLGSLPNTGALRVSRDLKPPIGALKTMAMSQNWEGLVARRGGSEYVGGRAAADLVRFVTRGIVCVELRRVSHFTNYVGGWAVLGDQSVTTVFARDNMVVELGNTCSGLWLDPSTGTVLPGPKVGHPAYLNKQDISSCTTLMSEQFGDNPNTPPIHIYVKLDSKTGEITGATVKAVTDELPGTDNWERVTSQTRRRGRPRLVHKKDWARLGPTLVVVGGAGPAGTYVKVMLSTAKVQKEAPKIPDPSEKITSADKAVIAVPVPITEDQVTQLGFDRRGKSEYYFAAGVDPATARVYGVVPNSL